MSGFTGKSLIVTGGASGIGRAGAQLLAEQGALVTIADIDEIAGKTTAVELCERGPGKAQFIHCDVASEDSVKAMVAAAVSAYGRLDGALNAAGVAGHGSVLHEMDAAHWRRTNAINLDGMFYCFKHEIAAMLETGGGAIVAVASAAAVMALINLSDYCASKAGITGLVRGAALDYAKRNIRINAILPGTTNTPLATRGREVNPAAVNSFVVPMNRRAEPVEIAAPAVWMLSDEAGYMTGACVCVDAGMTIA